MADTHVLKVITEFHPIGEIVIGPNDAYDLEILELTKDVKLIANGEIIPGIIIINNNCKDSTVCISKKLFEKIGTPQAIKLSRNGENLVIHNVKST